MVSRRHHHVVGLTVLAAFAHPVESGDSKKQMGHIAWLNTSPVFPPSLWVLFSCFVWFGIFWFSFFFWCVCVWFGSVWDLGFVCCLMGVWVFFLLGWCWFWLVGVFFCCGFGFLLVWVTGALAAPQNSVKNVAKKSGYPLHLTCPPGCSEGVTQFLFQKTTVGVTSRKIPLPIPQPPDSSNKPATTAIEWLRLFPPLPTQLPTWSSRKHHNADFLAWCVLIHCWCNKCEACTLAARQAHLSSFPKPLQ